MYLVLRVDKCKQLSDRPRRRRRLRLRVRGCGDGDGGNWVIVGMKIHVVRVCMCMCVLREVIRVTGVACQGDGDDALLDVLDLTQVEDGTMVREDDEAEAMAEPLGTRVGVDKDELDDDCSSSSSKTGSGGRGPSRKRRALSAAAPAVEDRIAVSALMDEEDQGEAEFDDDVRSKKAKSHA